MKCNFLLSSGFFLFTSMAVSLGQSGPAATASLNGGQGAPVSYASVTQLNAMLSQLEAASKNTQADLVR
jgi:hypothetical protein